MGSITLYQIIIGLFICVLLSIAAVIIIKEGFFFGGGGSTVFKLGSMLYRNMLNIQGH